MPGNPNDRNDWSARDRWNSLVVKTITPITGWALLAVVGLATFYVQTSFSEVKKSVALVSEESKQTAKEQVGMKEAVRRVEEKIEDFKVEQRQTNKEIKEGINWLIQQQRRPR